MRPVTPQNAVRAVVAVTVCALLGIAFDACRGSDRPDAPAANPDLASHPAAAPNSPRTPGSPPAERADFDFYLLAMTMHEAWCGDGNRGRKECRIGSDRPLVIHGLWPERVEPRTYPRDCPGPRLALETATESELETFMPGMKSGLHVHEWREHGTCSGLSDDDYFRATLDLARRMDDALRQILTNYAGREVSPRALRDATRSTAPDIAGTFTLHCRTLRDARPELRDRAFLVEIRQCVDDDGTGGAPGTPIDCESVNRRDQGCGESFRIATRRLGG
jgi:ribonuclease T2